MTAPTKAQIERAERIARQASDEHGLSMTYAVAQTAALAAIIETQEAIAGYLESVAVKRSDKMKIAAIRDGSYREGA